MRGQFHAGAQIEVEVEVEGGVEVELRAKADLDGKVVVEAPHFTDVSCN